MISTVTIFVLFISLAICNSSWLPHISITTPLPKIGVQSKLDGNTSKAIDVSLYSRQLLVYGESAQHRINNAHVAVLGSGLLATEVTKTLALAGVGRLSVMRTTPPKPEEVSIRRNQTLYEYAKALNNNIMVHELTNSSLTRNELLIRNFTAIIVTDKDFTTLVELDLLCKELSIPLCSVGVTGVYGYIFNDFHGKFHVHDVDGEESRSVPLTSNINTTTTSTTTDTTTSTGDTINIRLSSIEEERHNVGLYDTVEISHSSSTIQGRVTKVVDTHTIEVVVGKEWEEPITTMIQSGTAVLRKVKESISISHESLQLQLLRPSLCMSNECLPPKQDRALSLTVLACLKVYHQLAQSSRNTDMMTHNQWYEYWRVLVVEELRTMGIVDPELSLKQRGQIGSDMLDTVVSRFMQSIPEIHYTQTSSPLDQITPDLIVRTQCPACISVLGAVAAQEILKAVTHMYIPINQFFVFQALDALEERNAPQNDNITKTTNKILSKTSKKPIKMNKKTSKLSFGNNIPYNNDIMNELRSMKVFIVGAGAIGCELLKNFALLGVGIGRNHTKTMTINESNHDNTVERRYKSIQREGLWSTDQLQDGGIIITDMDCIERSNLNRQLLFREEHIGLYKSEVAVQQVVAINPHLAGRVLGLAHRVGAETEGLTHRVGADTEGLAHRVGTETEGLTHRVGAETEGLAHRVGAETEGLTHRVGAETEGLAHRVGAETEGLAHSVGQETTGGPFDAEFWEETDVVVTALDNVQARQYVDEQCVRYGKWLLDSGTLGTKGNTQVVIPHLTESYSSSADPEDSAVPICTIKTFPYQPEHCVAWAKSVFEQLFVQDAVLLRQLQDIMHSAQADTVEQRSNSVTAWLKTLSDEQVVRIHECVAYVPWNRQQSIKWAQRMFTSYYTDTAVALLREHPVDELDEEGEAFWGSSRRIPHTQTFDPTDPLHTAFVETLSSLRRRVLCGGGSSSSSGNNSGGSSTVEEDNLLNPVNHTVESHSSHIFERENLTEVILQSITHSAGSVEYCQLQQYRAQPEEFEKDDASLGHVDVITALTNLRCRMYSIPDLDRLQVQKIAGNIIPALASTTSVVAGLVTIELIKIASERVRCRQYRANLQLQQQQQKGYSRENKQVSKRLSLLPPISGMFRRFKDVIRNPTITTTNHHNNEYHTTPKQQEQQQLPLQREKYSNSKPIHWTKSYLLREKTRLLGRFRNSFLNLARPMLAFAQPQEAETWVLSGSTGTGSSGSNSVTGSSDSGSDSSSSDSRELYTLWDTITMPGNLRSITISQVRNYLHTLLHTTIETVSFGDTLLYASFDPASEKLEELTLYEALTQAISEGANTDIVVPTEEAEVKVMMDRLLVGKKFLLLQVTAAVEEVEEGGGGSDSSSCGDSSSSGGEMRLPPIKVYI